MLQYIKRVSDKIFARYDLVNDREQFLFLFAVASVFFAWSVHLFLIVHCILISDSFFLLVNFIATFLYIPATVCIFRHRYLLFFAFLNFDVCFYSSLYILHVGLGSYTILYYFSVLILNLLIPYAKTIVRFFMVCMIWACMCFVAVYTLYTQENAVVHHDHLLILFNINAIFIVMAMIICVKNVVNNFINMHNKGEIEKHKKNEQLEKEYSARLERTVFERTKELEKSREDALAASKAKSMFLSTVSHEIRTPMNVILGFLHLFNRENLTNEQNEQLNKIQIASNLLLDLINDVLDISKIESGRLILEHRPFALKPCIQSIHTVVAALAQKQKIDLVVEVAPNVPEGIVGDSQRLGQVLLNVLSNAIKFTPQGAVCMVVSLRDPIATDVVMTDDATVLQDNAARVVIGFSIKDTGIGIPKEKLQEIFKPFVQSDSSMSRQYGGTGLGLSICQRLVDMMGGRIYATSEVGQGSTFDITIRARIASTDEVLMHETAHRTEPDKIAMQENSLQNLHGKRILLVEDNAINQEIAQAMFDQYGLVTTTAANGKEAITIARKHTFDCIFMDIQMPVMDGLEATRRLRALGKDKHIDYDFSWLQTVPIIAMTANALGEDKDNCLKAGMWDHIGKPIEPKILEQCLLRWLGQEPCPPSYISHK